VGVQGVRRPLDQRARKVAAIKGRQTPLAAMDPEGIK
jgi:hypothetical protein